MIILYYKDNTKLIFDKIIGCKWNEIENKPIIKIEYYCGNKKLVMENYERYNHLVERASPLGKKPFVSKFILMGLEGERVTAITFNTVSKTVVRDYYKIGYEYNGGLTTGWKRGIVGKIGKFSLFDKNR